MSITIKEIAKLAGVSRGTVDRALNDRGRVAAEVKERILAIAHQYGYKKNVVASQLAKNESKYIGVVLPNPKYDPYWSFALEGMHWIQKSLSDFGIKVTHYDFNPFKVESYTSAIDAAIREKMDAIILVPTFAKQAINYLRIMDQNEIPVILIDAELKSTSVVSYIGQDCHQSGKVVGRLLHNTQVDQGRIYAITIGMDSLSGSHTSQKLEGLSQYLNDNNVNNIVEHCIVDHLDDNEAILAISNKMQEDLNAIGVFFTNSRAYHFFKSIKFKRPNKRFKTVAYDLLEQNIELLRNNNIDYILNQNPRKQTYFALVEFFQFFTQKKILPNKRYLPIDIIIKENYNYYLGNQEINIGLV